MPLWECRHGLTLRLRWSSVMLALRGFGDGTGLRRDAAAWPGIER